MGYLNPGMFPKCGHIAQDKILRPIWRGPSVLARRRFGEDQISRSFGMDEMSLWMFWRGTNVLQGFNFLPS